MKSYSSRFPLAKLLAKWLAKLNFELYISSFVKNNQNILELKNLIPKKPDTEDIGIQVGDGGNEDDASDDDDDGASESSTEETNQSKPMVVRSAMPRLTMVAMETVHITPDRPFSADSHLLPVLNKTEIEPSKLASSEISASTVDLKSSSVNSVSPPEENQNEKQSPRKKKSQKSSIRQNSSKDLVDENQNIEELKENVKFAESEKETGNNNVASITIVHKDSLLKSTSVQTDSLEDATIAVTKSPKKVTKKGKLAKKPSSESIKDRLFLSKVPDVETRVVHGLSR